MTLSILFAPEEEARLRRRAAAEGKDVGTYVREAALEKVDRPTMAEILAPIHGSTDAVCTSVDDVDAMADQARREVREQGRSSRKSTG